MTGIYDRLEIETLGANNYHSILKEAELGIERAR
jgi:hypothetical protein